ncbi:MAG: hypothetical protein RL065_971, partial [Bacteroidota bacterium]
MQTNAPLAERLRPKTLENFIGQHHLVGNQSVLRQMIENKKLSSLIFWGPPGVGKTTLAHIIANESNLPIYNLSAIESGVKDIRNVIDKAKEIGKAILFIDEIHRFNKAQQDSLLGAVEKGIITLIGATTENPSFEVIAPLLSRCQVYILKHFNETELLQLLHQALLNDEWLKQFSIEIKEHTALLQMSGGDARKLLNLLELIIQSVNQTENIFITDELVMKILQKKMALYDKSGEQHYDIISAFIKSI